MAPADTGILIVPSGKKSTGQELYSTHPMSEKEDIPNQNLSKLSKSTTSLGVFLNINHRKFTCAGLNFPNLSADFCRTAMFGCTGKKNQPRTIWKKHHLPRESIRRLSTEFRSVAVSHYILL